jgi:hypothetical protein
MHDDTKFDTPFEKSVRGNLRKLFNYDKRIPHPPDVAHISELMRALQDWADTQRLTSEDVCMLLAELLAFHMCALAPDNESKAHIGIQAIMMGVTMRMRGIYSVIKIVDDWYKKAEGGGK